MPKAGRSSTAPAPTRRSRTCSACRSTGGEPVAADARSRACTRPSFAQDQARLRPSRASLLDAHAAAAPSTRPTARWSASCRRSRRSRRSRRASSSSRSAKAPGFYAAVVRPRDFDAEEEVPGDRRRLRRAAPPARRWQADAQLAARPVARRPGLHRRRHRQPRHAGPRPRLGAGHLPEVRHACRSTTRSPGCKALGEKFPEMDLDRVGIVRLVVRRLHGGPGGAAAAGRLQGRRRRRPGHRLARLRHALHRALPRPARQGRRRPTRRRRC